MEALIITRNLDQVKRLKIATKTTPIIDGHDFNKHYSEQWLWRWDGNQLAGSTMTMDCWVYISNTSEGIPIYTMEGNIFEETLKRRRKNKVNADRKKKVKAELKAVMTRNREPL